MLLKRSLFIVILQAVIVTISAVKTIQSSDGANIWVEAVGNPQNQALVLIHGIGGSAMSWEDLIQEPRLLSNFYLVSLSYDSIASVSEAGSYSVSGIKVTYDLRGHGRSDKPMTASGYTSKLFADDFAAVSSAYNLKSPIVLGW